MVCILATLKVKKGKEELFENIFVELSKNVRKIDKGNIFYQISKDREIESNGVMLYIDPKSFLYLMGTEIDYVDNLNQSGFKFVNPNAKRTCGCGESFSI